MIEANSASSSANDVSISTWVSGRLARISRVASIPLPSDSRTSITTTSGRVRAASSIASRTVPASAVTTMSSSGVEHRADAVAHDLVVVDEHHAQRRRLRSPAHPSRPASAGLPAVVLQADLDGDRREPGRGSP